MIANTSSSSVIPRGSLPPPTTVTTTTASASSSSVVSQTYQPLGLFPTPPTCISKIPSSFYPLPGGGGGGGGCICPYHPSVVNTAWRSSGLPIDAAPSAASSFIPYTPNFVVPNFLPPPPPFPSRPIHRADVMRFSSSAIACGEKQTNMPSSSSLFPTSSNLLSNTFDFPSLNVRPIAVTTTAVSASTETSDCLRSTSSVSSYSSYSSSNLPPHETRLKNQIFSLSRSDSRLPHPFFSIPSPLPVSIKGNSSGGGGGSLPTIPPPIPFLPNLPPPPPPLCSSINSSVSVSRDSSFPIVTNVLHSPHKGVSSFSSPSVSCSSLPSPCLLNHNIPTSSPRCLYRSTSNPPRLLLSSSTVATTATAQTPTETPSASPIQKSFAFLNSNLSSPVAPVDTSFSNLFSSSDKSSNQASISVPPSISASQSAVASVVSAVPPSSTNPLSFVSSGISPPSPSPSPPSVPASFAESSTSTAVARLGLVLPTSTPVASPPSSHVTSDSLFSPTLNTSALNLIPFSTTAASHSSAYGGVSPRFVIRQKNSLATKISGVSGGYLCVSSICSTMSASSLNSVMRDTSPCCANNINVPSFSGSRADFTPKSIGSEVDIDRSKQQQQQQQSLLMKTMINSEKNDDDDDDDGSSHSDILVLPTSSTSTFSSSSSSSFSCFPSNVNSFPVANSFTATNPSTTFTHHTSLPFPSSSSSSSFCSNSQLPSSRISPLKASASAVPQKDEKSLEEMEDSCSSLLPSLPSLQVSTVGSNDCIFRDVDRRLVQNSTAIGSQEISKITSEILPSSSFSSSSSSSMSPVHLSFFSDGWKGVNEEEEVETEIVHRSLRRLINNSSRGGGGRVVGEISGDVVDNEEMMVGGDSEKNRGRRGIVGQSEDDRNLTTNLTLRSSTVKAATTRKALPSPEKLGMSCSRNTSMSTSANDDNPSNNGESSAFDTTEDDVVTLEEEIQTTSESNSFSNSSSQDKCSSTSSSRDITLCPNINEEVSSNDDIMSLSPTEGHRLQGLIAKQDEKIRQLEEEMQSMMSNFSVKQSGTKNKIENREEKCRKTVGMLVSSSSCSAIPTIKNHNTCMRSRANRMKNTTTTDRNIMSSSATNLPSLIPIRRQQNKNVNSTSPRGLKFSASKPIAGPLKLMQSKRSSPTRLTRKLSPSHYGPVFVPSCNTVGSSSSSSFSQNVPTTNGKIMSSSFCLSSSSSSTSSLHRKCALSIIPAPPKVTKSGEGGEWASAATSSSNKTISRRFGSQMSLGKVAFSTTVNGGGGGCKGSSSISSSLCNSNNNNGNSNMESSIITPNRCSSFRSVHNNNNNTTGGGCLSSRGISHNPLSPSSLATRNRAVGDHAFGSVLPTTTTTPRGIARSRVGDGGGVGGSNNGKGMWEGSSSSSSNSRRVVLGLSSSSSPLLASVDEGRPMSLYSPRKHDEIDHKLAEWHNSHNSLVSWCRINRGLYLFGETEVTLDLINGKLMACVDDFTGWNRGKMGSIEKFVNYFEGLERGRLLVATAEEQQQPTSNIEEFEKHLTTSQEKWVEETKRRDDENTKGML